MTLNKLPSFTLHTKVISIMTYDSTFKYFVAARKQANVHKEIIALLGRHERNGCVKQIFELDHKSCLYQPDNGTKVIDEYYVQLCYEDSISFMLNAYDEHNINIWVHNHPANSSNKETLDEVSLPDIPVYAIAYDAEVWSIYNDANTNSSYWLIATDADTLNHSIETMEKEKTFIQQKSLIFDKDTGIVKKNATASMLNQHYLTLLSGNAVSVEHPSASNPCVKTLSF